MWLSERPTSPEGNGVLEKGMGREPQLEADQVEIEGLYFSMRELRASASCQAQAALFQCLPNLSRVNSGSKSARPSYIERTDIAGEAY